VRIPSPAPPAEERIVLAFVIWAKQDFRWFFPKSQEECVRNPHSTKTQSIKMGYIYLAIAVLAEVAGTSFLKATEGFTRPGPTAFVLVAYGLAFWMLSLSLKTMTVAVVYALWCGAGIALIALIGWFLLKQPLDLPALIGIGLILAGVVVINLFSSSVRH
jgi:small multidrug resistance pump